MELWILFIIFFAVILDIVFGELPTKLHPVVWMGNLINIFKPILLKLNHKISGLFLTIILSLIFILFTIAILLVVNFNIILTIFVSAILLSSTFSIKFLIKSSEDIKHDIQTDIEKSRKSVSFLVSRDTSNLSYSQIISATVESLTENITDSVTAPLFFAYLFGVPGAMFYRVVNTLDAMVGYKNKENIRIGWFPAKLDDLLNYIPARITGLIIVISAFILKMNWKNSYHILKRDARSPPSPNSGYSMAAVAGALDIKLEKVGVYVIGDDKHDLSAETIDKAIKLTKLTILIYLMIFTLIFLLIYFILNIY